MEELFDKFVLRLLTLINIVRLHFGWKAAMTIEGNGTSAVIYKVVEDVILVLIQKHPNRKAYELPGGGVGRYETFDAATGDMFAHGVSREVYEELGLETYPAKYTFEALMQQLCTAGNFLVTGCLSLFSYKFDEFAQSHWPDHALKLQLGEVESATWKPIVEAIENTETNSSDGIYLSLAHRRLLLIFLYRYERRRIKQLEYILPYQGRLNQEITFYCGQYGHLTV